MSFDYDDPYAKIDCKVLKVTAKAVQVEGESGDAVWIPRSCLHGADDTRIDDAVGDDVELKIRAWVAKREGLI